MLQGERQLRVRYQETDTMGVVNHMNYINYFEVARTELLRTTGTTYREMEEQGVMLPVVEVGVRYIKPAHYDDLLTIRLRMEKLPTVKMRFDYEVLRGEELLTTGFVVLAFMDATTRRPCRGHKRFMDAITPYFQ